MVKMHSYSTDSDERSRATVFIAILSILTLLTLNSFLGSFPWWIEPPSVLGFYMGISTIFDRYVWRIPLLSKLGFIKLPDLNGTWRGTVCSSHHHMLEKRIVTIQISQTWSAISITLESAESVSQSCSASLYINDAEGAILRYQYRNTPHPTSKKAMQSHWGTVKLCVKGNRLVGDYYTGHERQTYGELELRRLTADR
jgi:hypothetical protein